jgi:misacylated tRNA(Ala) deacylase
MATEELFRGDAQLLACQATVLTVEETGIVLDRTVFYPLGGGQAGDSGTLTGDCGAVLAIADTRKHPTLHGTILHVPIPGADMSGLQPGMRVSLQVNAERRLAHMRFPHCNPPAVRLVPPTPSMAARSRQPMHGSTSTRPSRWTRSCLQPASPGLSMAGTR